MTADTAGDLFVFLGEMAAVLTVFSIGGFIADFILPHIGFIERYLDSLPNYEDDAKIARRYEKIRRMKATLWRKIIKETANVIKSSKSTSV